MAMLIATNRRDLSKARDFSRIAREIGEEHGFPEIVHYGVWGEGYARFCQGERTVDLSDQKVAIKELEILGSLIGSSWEMACLAEEHLQLGDHDAAESSLQRAFEIVKETEEGWAEPELHRIAAEAILRKPGGDVQDAQRRFEEAIALARKQNSKWWELRATVGLARLQQKQGKRDEARTMLVDIYNWFTEGFDTADLKDAKALLDELAE
jgi:tetratricopeptide (TPR) repeat protein